MTSEYRGYHPIWEKPTALRRRSRAWRTVCKGNTSPPAAYSTRDWKKRVEDQGKTPSCGGQALSNALEGVYHLATQGEVVELSRKFAWLECQRKDGGELDAERGVSINGVAYVGTTIGLPIEALCPFEGVGSNGFNPAIDPAAYRDAADHIASAQFWIDSYAKLIDFLHAGAGAAVIGVPWEFSRRKWHAVCLSGWQANGDIEGENSWGPDWDGDGYFQWSIKTVEKYFRTSGVICVGLSDMTTPNARDWDWHKDFLV